MCINCSWKVLRNKTKALIVNKFFANDTDELTAFVIKLNTNQHCTTEDVYYFNSLMDRLPEKIEKPKVVKARFDPVEILSNNPDLLNNYKTVSDDGTYVWNERGLWIREHPDQIDRMLVPFIPQNKSVYLNELSKFFKMGTLLPKNNKMNFDRYTINMNNGMMDLRTGNLTPHHKDFLSTVQIPIDFNPNATCERWENFISEVIDDMDTEKILQEFVGYSMIPDTKFEKCLILIGSGANGKSTFLSVISEIIGKDNISRVKLSDLSSAFSRIQLQNKLVNMGTELETGDITDTGYFKSITSGEEIDARYLFKDMLVFKPFCKLIFAMNNLPVFKDKSNGLYRRFLIIDFPKSFESNPNRNLAQELLVERSGIFNWALKGLQRLWDNDGFTKSIKSELEGARYRVQNNSVMSFVADRLTIVDDLKERLKYHIEKQELYNLYKVYCEDNGLRPVSSITMTKDIATVYKDKLILAPINLPNGSKRVAIFGVHENL